MADIKLKVLGSGDAFGTQGRFNTSFYVQAPSTNFLIDCGASTLVALKKYKVDPNSIDAIVLTHFHGDHFGGVPFILLDAFIIQKRTKPLTIFSPSGGQEKIMTLMEALYPGTGHIFDNLDLKFATYIEDGAVQSGALKVQAYPVIHSAPSLPHAVRVQVDNRTIAYSGDSEWTPNLTVAADGADLFITECNVFDQPVKAHLSYKELLENRDKLHCRRLAITHMGQEMFDNLDQVEIECLEDGMELEI
ncbi:MAG: MBL fold metallo-hydrolase [Bacteroidota bacterium]